MEIKDPLLGAVQQQLSRVRGSRIWKKEKGEVSEEQCSNESLAEEEKRDSNNYPGALWRQMSKRTWRRLSHTLCCATPPGKGVARGPTVTKLTKLMIWS